MTREWFTAILMACATPATADPFAVLSFGSHHIGAHQQFEQVNPGAGLGWRWGDHTAIEASVYRNSFGEVSTAAVVSLETGGPVSIGTFAGLATYRAGQVMEGFPVLDLGRDRVAMPVAGLQLRMKIDQRHAIQIRALPAGGKIADAILTFQITFDIGNRP